MGVGKKTIEKMEENLKKGNGKKITNGILAGSLGGAGAAGATYWLVAASVPAAPVAAAFLAPIVAPLALVTGVGAGAAIIGGAIGYRFTKGKKEALKDLNETFIGRLKRNMEDLKESKNSEKIDFIFNLESALYPKYQKLTIGQTADTSANNNALLPQNMAIYFLKISNIFREIFKRKPESRPLVERIVINNAEMTDDQFLALIEHDIGCCGTTTLDLSKNRLTTVSIQTLRDKIVRNETFHQLKSLNLSHNNLSNITLDSIIRIVAHLEIEELDLSGNDLNGANGNINLISKELVSFIRDQPKTMPSLKVLKIADIGLTDNFAESLREMLRVPSILKHLDIRQNANLKNVAIQKVIVDQGLSLNQSIREFLVDNQDSIDIRPPIKDKVKLCEEMANLSNQCGEKEAAPMVFLLNRFCLKKNERLIIKTKYKVENNGKLSPERMKEIEPMMDLGMDKWLSGQYNQIAKDIKTIRMRVFQIEKDYSIPISEKEFVMYRRGQLENFYLHAIAKKEKTGLDAQLFKRIDALNSTQANDPTMYDLDLEAREKAQKATLADRIKPGITKVF